ncbi:MAG TPA: hypothetical protein VMB72_00180 [Acidimicrobiales bacterium]|nr:hypothetical protein [Acidimicrobiales bacterium]
MTDPCTWCDLVGSGAGALYESESFTLLGAVVPCPFPLTLVPRAHAAVLTDLDPGAMAGVLAGLARLSRAVRPTDRLDISAHLGAGGDHVHFHPTLTSLGPVGVPATPIRAPDDDPLACAMVAALRAVP